MEILKPMIKKMEYSKIISSIFISCFLFGIIIGTYAVIQDPANIDPLLIYIGGATTVSTSFYFWKAKAENLIKIQKSNPEVFKVLATDTSDEEDGTEEEIE